MPTIHYTSHEFLERNGVRVDDQTSTTNPHQFLPLTSLLRNSASSSGDDDVSQQLSVIANSRSNDMYRNGRHAMQDYDSG